MVQKPSKLAKGTVINFHNIRDHWISNNFKDNKCNECVNMHRSDQLV